MRELEEVEATFGFGSLIGPSNEAYGTPPRFIRFSKAEWQESEKGITTFNFRNWAQSLDRMARVEQRSLPEELQGFCDFAQRLQTFINENQKLNHLGTEGETSQ